MSSRGGPHVRVRLRADINQEANNLAGTTPPRPSYVDAYQKVFGMGMGSLAWQGAQPRRSATGGTFYPHYGPSACVRVPWTTQVMGCSIGVFKWFGLFE